MSLQEMIAELERLCPGCTFTIDDVPIGAEVIHIDEAGRPFTVNLAKFEVTVEEWFQNEIEKHPGPPPVDAKYKINCSQCGSVTLGYIGYIRQMARPNSFWFCPQCGGRASFDDENFESRAQQPNREKKNN